MSSEAVEATSNRKLCSSKERGISVFIICFSLTKLDHQQPEQISARLNIFFQALWLIWAYHQLATPIDDRASLM